MKSIIGSLMIILCFSNCGKIEKIKSKIFPDRPYEKAKIDKFYWADSGWDYSMIPLIKPFQLIKLQGDNTWQVSTGFNKFNEISIGPIDNVWISKEFIFGHKTKEVRDFDDRKISIGEFWFIINIKKGFKESALSKFNSEQDFKAELKKLHLPETFLTPDEVYEQYTNDPVLPWFPEDIKKQLEEVKKQKK